MTVSWSAPNSGTATNYYVFRNTTTGNNFTLVSPSLSGSTYTWLDTTGTAGSTYYYELTCGNSAGNSSASYPIVSATFSGGGTGGGSGGTSSASQAGLIAALSWSGGSLTISYTGQDSFVQCSWPGGSYSSGDGSTLATPAPHILSPAPPVGSSVTFFGKNTPPQILTVQDSGTVPTNVTTTTGGDGYVPSGASAPKHDPGSLSIGFGKFGSISVPSGWWSEVITYASQLAMEA